MIYLDNAATDRYVPEGAMRAFVAAVNRKCNAGRAAHRDSAALALGIYRVREKIKTLLDNPQAEVVFTKNCTEALNLAIRGVSFGHIVTTVTEHNSVLRPLAEMERGGQITLSFVSPISPDVGVVGADIEGAIRASTRLVVVNHVSNVTGITNDILSIGKVCARHGVPLLVDAAQSLGHLPLSMRMVGCDMVAAPAHKGLHGLQGGGFLAFNRNRHISPLLFGGTGTDSTLLTQPTSIEGLEAGTINGAGIMALGAAIDWTVSHFDTLQSRSASYLAALRKGLGRLPNLRVYGGANGILSLSIGDMPSTYLADKLDEMGIACRAGLHCAPLMHKFLGTQKQGLVRLSWGWQNRLSEIPRVLEALARLSHS